MPLNGSMLDHGGLALFSGWLCPAADPMLAGIMRCRCTKVRVRGLDTLGDNKSSRLNPKRMWRGTVAQLHGGLQQVEIVLFLDGTEIETSPMNLVTAPTWSATPVRRGHFCISTQRRQLRAPCRSPAVALGRRSPTNPPPSDSRRAIFATSVARLRLCCCQGARVLSQNRSLYSCGLNCLAVLFSLLKYRGRSASVPAGRVLAFVRPLPGGVGLFHRVQGPPEWDRRWVRRIRGGNGGAILRRERIVRRVSRLPLKTYPSPRGRNPCPGCDPATPSGWYDTRVRSVSGRGPRLFRRRTPPRCAARGRRAGRGAGRGTPSHHRNDA